VSSAPILVILIEHQGAFAMDQQSSILQIGVPLDASSPLFFACLLAAVAIVYVACRKKFAERSVTGSEDYIYQFLPRQLATREE
jgi:hypothetical protein